MKMLSGRSTSTPCYHCQGTGWIYSTQWEPWGDTQVPLHMKEKCSCWAEDEQCPRCNSPNLEWNQSYTKEAEAHCLDCGWNSINAKSVNTAQLWPIDEED